MELKCWNCGATVEEFPEGRVPFRATCESCDAWLHCCKNCVHYHPGLPNDCEVPGTDLIRDREASNFCEDFKVLGKKGKPLADPDDVAKHLFG